MLDRLRSLFSAAPALARDVVAEVDAFLDEVPEEYWTVSATKLPSAGTLLAGDAKRRGEAVIACIRAIGRLGGQHAKRIFAFDLSAALLNSQPELSDAQLEELVQFCAAEGGTPGATLPVSEVLAAREERGSLPAPLVAAVEALHRGWSEAQASLGRKQLPLLERVLGRRSKATLQPDDPWAAAAAGELATLSRDAQARWELLLAHTLEGEGARPTGKWLKAAAPLIETVGRDDFRSRVLRWFGRAGPRDPATVAAAPGLLPDTRISEHNATVLRGLVWAASTLDDTELCRAIGELGVSCFRKIPGVGAVSTRVGNGCIWALGAMTGLEPVAQLGRLARKVKYAQAQRLIQDALEASARKAGLSRDELEELAVPTFGLEANGVRREPLGEHVAELAVRGTDVSLVFFAADGKALKSVPAAVKTAHAEELRELKQAARDLEAMVATQRTRLEQLFLAERRWPFARWRERYVEHPLVGALARPLIWAVLEGSRARSFIAHQGGWVDATGAAVTPADDAIVTPWHPLTAAREEVLAWRRFLEDRGYVQPFKQAHREIYVLTDAERGSGTYSNRFAAHVLRQHQFAALCRERGWRYTLQGAFDSHNTPTLALPRYGLSAEFWVEGIHGLADVAESGIYVQVSTDQVRFVDGAGQPRPLEEVPPLLFSEVMRDVDLFVGVCSIGNDPTWADRGDAGPRTYWEAYSFGELSGSALTRREILEQLLPKLAPLRDVCRLDGKFLVVDGKLRTYKIHLGSGNILMAPNDQYLCIVPARTAKQEPVLLPFEGDALFALILSKALLLVKDDRITDPTIKRQIARG